jgi:hypothetical protein
VLKINRGEALEISVRNEAMHAEVGKGAGLTGTGMPWCQELWVMAKGKEGVGIEWVCIDLFIRGSKF